MGTDKRGHRGMTTGKYSLAAVVREAQAAELEARRKENERLLREENERAERAERDKGE